MTKYKISILVDRKARINEYQMIIGHIIQPLLSGMEEMDMEDMNAISMEDASSMMDALKVGYPVK